MVHNIRNIFKQTPAALAALTLAFVLTGCASRNPIPTPGQTITGNYTNQETAGWIPDTALVPAGGELDAGLAPRNAGSNAFGAASSNSAIGENSNNPLAQANAFASIYYGFDSSGIESSQRTAVREAAEYLRANPNSRLLVVGHCDWYGTPEYNLALGERRAASVQRYLADLGIPSTRVDLLSKGDTEAADGGNSEQRRLDRRADLFIR